MALFRFIRDIAKKHSIIPFVICICITTGCAQSGDVQTSPEQMSVSWLLAYEEWQLFQKGKNAELILEDIQWRGNFEEAAQLSDKVVSTINFGVLPAEVSEGDERDSVLAVFIEGKFDKFVQPPACEMETVDFEGTPASRIKPRKISDTSRLEKAVASSPLDRSDLQIYEAAPSRTDPGLTAVWLAFQASKLLSNNTEYADNAALRDQFNASRLKIGMSKQDVNAVLKAEPLESGVIESEASPASSMHYSIYGSTTSFDLVYPFHYFNVLVLFQDGSVNRILTVPRGEDMRSELVERFSDVLKPMELH